MNPLSIKITLGDALKSWADDWNPRKKRLLWKLETGVQALLDELGIPAKHEVTLLHEPGKENLQVFVGEAMQPYSTEMLCKVMEYFAGRLSLTADKTSGWEKEFVGDGAADSFADFLPQLVVEILRQRPEALFVEQPSVAESVSRSLLRMKVSIKELKAGSENAELMDEEIKRGRTGADIAELLAARLVPNRIEIEMHPEYLTQLFGIEKLAQDETVSVYGESVSKEVREQFKMLADGMFDELGMRVPDVVLRTSDDLKVEGLRFKINGFQCSPRLGIPSNLCLANDTKDRLQLLGIELQPMSNPANGNPCCLIRQEDRQKVEASGRYVWDARGVLVLALSRELRRHAGRLMHQEVAEFELAKLDGDFSELVNLVMEEIPLARLTRVLRALLEEEVSIRDLRVILERMMACESIVFDAREQIVFDDRLVFHTEPAEDWRDDGHSMTQYVRAGLKRQIIHKYMRGQSTLAVYLVAPDIENLLFEHLAHERGDTKKNRLDEGGIERIRQAVRKEVGASSFSSNPSAILTQAEIRRLLRHLIAGEFPGLPVLAYEELSPETSIQPIGRIE